MRKNLLGGGCKGGRGGDRCGKGGGVGGVGGVCVVLLVFGGNSSDLGFAPAHVPAKKVNPHN